MKVPEIDLPKEILQKLYDFQKDGIRYGMMNKGRILIADEMGVGKTIQAICLASSYMKNTNKLIIICPSSLKYYWKDEILKWNVQRIASNQIQVFTGSSDQILLNTRILICSYDIIESNINKITKYNAYIGIADEAHYLKNPDTKRAKAITPYLKQLKHVILLTGTPAFARPKEMFTLVSILRPDVFTNFLPYGQRYCNPKKSSFHHGIDYQGSSNEEELHYLLTKNMMIRRLKKDVLNQLPSKKRRKILVNVDMNIRSQIQQILNPKNKSEYQSLNLEKCQLDNINDFNNGNSRNFEALQMCYRLSGLAKLKEVQNYLNDLIQQAGKIIVFAQHNEILNQLEAFIKSKKKGYIRIDGIVNPEERYKRVQQFQNNQSISVAILSYKAGSEGITLTAASNILFAEMHWTPAVMQQAEDRAHRIGQKTCVTCHYVIGQGTLDSLLYRQIEEKLQVVGNILDGKKGNLNMDEIKDQNGTIKLIKQPIQKLEDKFKIEQKQEIEQKQNNNSKFKQSSLLSFISKEGNDKNEQKEKQIETIDIESENKELSVGKQRNQEQQRIKRSRKDFEKDNKHLIIDQIKPEKQLKMKHFEKKATNIIVID